MTTSLAQMLETHQAQQAEQEAKSRVRLLTQLVQPTQYVGEVFSLGYESALVQIHDFHRQQVGGIPSLGFLIATRINPDVSFDFTTEDASVVLLRVMDAAALPNEAEAIRVRVETAQRVSGEPEIHWGDPGSMDPATHNLLSFAGIRCRVIGTFFLDREYRDGPSDNLTLRFGIDISNYYPNKGLKVYKPNEKALSCIVNYRDTTRRDQRIDRSVRVGDVRYASTNRSFQGVHNVPVELVPEDLLSQKTALFGMTRTGKSNTTKTIIKTVFNLRSFPDNSLRVGQIVFDPDGEYANENVQDQDARQNPAAVKNIGPVNGDGKRTDVVTYGLQPHKNDPDRKLMLLNFFDSSNLQMGKEILDSVLADASGIYMSNFRQLVFEEPDPNDRSASIRHARHVLVYRALLAKAGLEAPSSLEKAKTTGLFNKKLLTALSNSTGANGSEHQSAGKILGNPTPSWSQLADALRS